VVTILFADLVGSTQLGESQDPERTRAMLERFYEAMAAEVTAAGGTVEKFAGDAVMAACRSLLVCAAACAALGDEAEAGSLEREADRLRMEGFGWIIDTPRLRLALNRRDPGAVSRLIAETTAFIPRRAIWYFPAAVATHLEALAALGDAERLESDAAEFIPSDSVLSAFAMRGLGTLRGDPSLLDQAASRFDAYGFDAQAAHLRRLQGT